MDEALANARALRSRNLDAGGAPAPPVLTLVVRSYNAVKISWPADSAAAHFVVLRSTDGDATYSTLAAAVLNTFYEDDAVAANTLYVYQAHGVGVLGEVGELSPALPVWTKPAAVTNLVGSVNGSNQVSLTWTPADGPGGILYHVSRVGSGGSFPTPLPAYGEVVTHGQAYSFLVWASGPGGDGPAAFVNLGDGVSAPTNLTLGAVTTTTVALTWTGDTGAGISYEVRSSLNGTDYTAAATSSTTGVTVTGLATGTAYSFRVYRLQGGVYLGPSNTVTATTLSTPSGAPPLTPASLRATSVLAASVTLAWDASAGATSYNVYQAGTLLTSGVTEAAYEDDTVTSNAAYYYRVTAVNAYGESGLSNEAVVTTLSADAQNLQPAGLYWATADTVALMWDAATDGTTAWEVSVSTDGGVTFSPFQLVGTNSGTVTNLTPDTPYTFMVQAVNSAAVESPAGTAPTYAGTTLQTPGQPAFVSATGNSLTISWTGDAPGYDVTVSGSPEGGATVATNVPSPCTVSGLNPGTTYYFIVNNTGQNSTANTGPWSNGFQTLLNPPTVTAADANSSSDVTVSWTPDPSNTPASYNLYQNGSLRVPNVVMSPYDDGGLTPNRTYAYSVTSLDNLNNESAPSNTVNATTLSHDVTGLVVTAVPSASEVDLTWDGPSDGTTVWNVYVSTDGSSWSAAAGTVGTGTASVTGLAANTLYHFLVTAVNSSEQESPQGSAPTVTATTLNAAPYYISANAVSASEVDFTWAAADGVSGFDLYASTDDGDTYVLLASNQPNPVNVTSGLTANTGYKFIVVNTGDPLTNNSGTVNAATWPTDPTDLAVVSNNPAELDLSWITDGQCTNFEVEIQASGGDWSSPVVDDASPGNTANSAVYTAANGLASGTTYDVRLRSVNGSYYTTGNWVEVDGVTTE